MWMVWRLGYNHVSMIELYDEMFTLFLQSLTHAKVFAVSY